jgi:hypothetical protein
MGILSERRKKNYKKKECCKGRTRRRTPAYKWKHILSPLRKTNETR